MDTNALRLFVLAAEKLNIIAFKDLSPRKLTGPNGAEMLFDPKTSQSRLIVDDGLSQKIATLGRAGVSLNSLWSAQKEHKSGALVRVLTGWSATADAALWPVYPKSNVISVKVRVFMDFLLAHLQGQQSLGGDQQLVQDRPLGHRFGHVL